MATWEDGPEYAPVERPNEFSIPDAAPLSVAPPYLQPAADAPSRRPSFADPGQPVAPLAALVPAQEEPRDPGLPFEIVSSAATASESAWGAAHWSPPSGAGTATPVSGPSEPPRTISWDPRAPMSLTAHAPQVPAGYPAPNTPPWFGPAPYPVAPPPPPVTAKEVIRVLTPGLLIVLAIGALIYVLAPITLALGWGLTSRVQVAQSAVRRTLSLAMAALGLVGMFIALTGVLDFSDWWNKVGWSALLMSWAALVALPILAVRGLRSGTRGTRWE